MTAAPPSNTGCGVTVLRTVKDARATKRWRWDVKGQEWSKISYEAGAWFIPQEHQIADLAGLVEVLDVLRRDPRAFVVRGSLTPGTVEAIAAATDRRETHLIRRRKHAKGDIMPSLAEVPRRWIMVDIDNWPLPGWGDLVDDPETAIDTAIHELLPAPFHDAECWWQLSSSAGFAVGYLKVHLFFWLSEPVANAHIKAVLKQHAPGVDRAPFSAAQPHFIADPIIEGGHDPLPRRTGWRRGIEHVVVLPALRVEAPRARPIGQGAGTRLGDIMDALAFMGHAGIEKGLGGDGFHEPLRTATMRYAQRCNRYNDRDDNAIKAELRDAIRCAPCRPGGNVETPYCQDYYLDSMIEGAFALLAGDGEIQTMRPQHAAPGQSLEEARIALAEHVGGFFDRSVAWHRLTEMEQNERPAEHAALVVTVGAGKSHAAREALERYIAVARGEDRTLEQKVMEGALPHRVLWLVPHHKGSGEALERMQALGINAAIMRGREAEEPGTAQPEYGEAAGKMCLNLPAVADAIAAGYDADSAACGKGGKNKPVCPYRATCAYQRQKPLVKRADVLIATHDSLFHPLSKEVTEGIGVVIVDESWWQKGLHPNRPSRLESFAQEVISYPVNKAQPAKGAKLFRYQADDEKTNDLNTYALRAMKAFEQHEEGEFISRAAVVKAGLTANDCADAFKLEWERQRVGLVWPGQPEDDRRTGVQEAWGNLTLARRAGIWEALRELLAGFATHTGRLQVKTLSDKEGPYRAIVLHSRSEVKAAVSKLPMLMLDATMPTDLVRHYLPRLEVLAEVKVAAPHMEVYQVLGGWGKTSIVPSPKAAPEENRRRENLAGELADFVQLNSGGNGLVITYEAIEERFAGVPGIRTGHFNAIAGLDQFRDVRSAFVIGRPLPDARVMRDDALALTGRPIALEPGRMETRGALMVDGTGQAINVRCYADADMEAMRAAITDAEVIQAVGRVRGVRRTVDDPVTMFVMADVVLPLPVTALTRWADLRLDVMSRMRARGAVLLGATDAAKTYPDLFPTAEAAKKALQRAGPGKGDLGDIPLRESILGECPLNRLLAVTYRPGGRGQQQRIAKVAVWRLNGFREWLTGLLGELTVYTVGDAPPEPSPNAPRPAKPAQSPPAPSEPETVKPEPAWESEPPPAWADDPGWTPDASGPDLTRWEQQFAEAPPCPQPETEHAMQFTDYDQPGLDPGQVYPVAIPGWGMLPPVELIRLPPGTFSRAAARGDPLASPSGRMGPPVTVEELSPKWNRAT